MKLYFYVISLIAVDMFFIGSVMPALFSANSNEAVIAGFLLVAFAPILNFLGIKGIIKMVKQLLKKPETTNETAN